MSPRKSASSLLIILPLLAPMVAGAEEVPDFAACEARFAKAPGDEESAKCFYDLARAQAPLSSEAETRMRRHLAQHPGSPWLPLYLGHLLAFREPERAEPMYRQAAAACAAHSIPRCEVLARANLQSILDNQGHAEAAGRQAERAERVAQRSGEAGLIARSRMVRARHLYLLGQDLERAYLLLRRAKDFAFPDGPYALRRECLIWLGNVSLELGRSREAQSYFERLDELTAREGD